MCSPCMVHSRRHVKSKAIILALTSVKRIMFLFLVGENAESQVAVTSVEPNKNKNIILWERKFIEKRK